MFLDPGDPYGGKKCTLFLISYQTQKLTQKQIIGVSVKTKPMKTEKNIGDFEVGQGYLDRTLKVGDIC